VHAIDGGQEANHPDRVPLPGGVELLLFLEEGGQLLGDEQHPILCLLGPGHHVGRRRQIEVLVGPHPAGGAKSSLDLVEQERHVVHPREHTQPAKKPPAGQPDPAFALDRLGQNARAA
jgi:hypothetical protein